jgi:adenosine 3'-phospho 5'-phosphosulfate transporter B3
MIIATIINKRIFSSLEYTCGLAVCLGLVFFTAADWKLTPSFNFFGLILVSLSVIADSILPNLQEKLFESGISRLEVTFFSNLFTLIAMTLTTFMSGDLLGLLRLASEDSALSLYMLVYTMVAYVAISFFMQIVKRFGAVTGVLVATTRKGMTLMLSFLLFPKAFSWFYVVGAVLVLGGLLSSSLIKINKKNRKRHDNEDDVEMNHNVTDSQSDKKKLLDNISLSADTSKDEEMGR